MVCHTILGDIWLLVIAIIYCCEFLCCFNSTGYTFFDTFGMVIAVYVTKHQPQTKEKTNENLPINRV